VSFAEHLGLLVDTIKGINNTREWKVGLLTNDLTDGPGWEGVYNILNKDGYAVTIVQNPTISLADDVAVTKRAIAVQNGPVILVGHSYGGAVITDSGNDPKVAGRGDNYESCARPSEMTLRLRSGIG
jgi:hypothetical protein